jgi:glycogen operon protein
VSFVVEPGRRFPLGARATSRGVNFSIFSPHATAVELLLYGSADEEKPLLAVTLDPRVHRTFAFWHVFVRDAEPGVYYTWRIDGPRAPERGFRFDPRRELLDPWAKSVSDARWDRTAARTQYGPHFRARVVEEDRYDWEGDRPLRRSLQDAIIYELHVGAFTQDPSAGVGRAGTFGGVIEKIPYLKSLGVTDVELMPVMAFDTQDVPAAVTVGDLENYWGYSPVGFYAPHRRFAHGVDERKEFRDMVKALHRAGIGVILDVVLNHTAEGGEDGVTIGFKGLGNEFFYHLDPQDRRRYRDYTGCGNTVNCNHPFVMVYLRMCLEYWVLDMHVDGFRFDLASVMSRGEDGQPVYHAALPWSIEFSAPLARTHLIAEAWDAAGLYQVGDFPGFRWAEWNGRYRDAIRRFVRGEPGVIGEVATRIAGSSDMYAPLGKFPSNGINFITCHDGFTLYDLVSYEDKHNEANGENNRDGGDHNLSSNCGVEGTTDDPYVLRLRAQRARNFHALLMLSQGVPMLLAGDEMLRTQQGNNNAYCQNNEISWVDWSLTDAARGMLRFTREMIALRKRHPALRRQRFIEPSRAGTEPEIRWYGAQGREPDWNDGAACVLCFTLAGLTRDEAPLHVMMNMAEEAMFLPLPDVAGRAWHRVVDTSRAPPDDIVAPADAVPVGAPRYELAAGAIAVFEAINRARERERRAAVTSA